MVRYCRNVSISVSLEPGPRVALRFQNTNNILYNMVMIIIVIIGILITIIIRIIIIIIIGALVQGFRVQSLLARIVGPDPTATSQVSEFWVLVAWFRGF